MISTAAKAEMAMQLLQMGVINTPEEYLNLLMMTRKEFEIWLATHNTKLAKALK